MTADDLARILDDLGQRLGPTGEYVFGLAVRQVYIEAATSIILLIVLVALGLTAGPRIYRWTQDGGSYSDREFVGVILGLFYGCFTVYAVILLLSLVPAVLNPEYAALTNLLDRLP